MKIDDVIVEKNVPEQWRHQALVNAWPFRIDARRQFMLLVVSVFVTLLTF